MDRFFPLVVLALLICFMATAPVAAEGYGRVETDAPRAASPSQFGSVSFPLEGSQEVPPVMSDRTGSCDASLNGLGTEFSISCSHDVGDVIGAHIHNEAAGENGPVVFFFDAVTSFSAVVSEASIQQQIMDGLLMSPISFEQFLAELIAGNLYVNIHSPANPPGELRGQIPPPPHATIFAQFGNGTTQGFSLQSDIVLLNTASTGDPVTGSILLYDQNGDPIPGDSVFGSSSMSTAAFPQDAHAVGFSLDPLGDATFSTTGMGDIVAGSAQVVSDGPVAGFIRFGITGIGIAGVGASPVTDGAIAPARRSGSLSTGLAIRNAEAFPITVNLSLRTNGVEVANGNVDIMLNPNARVSQFLQEYFPDADTMDFNGSIIMTADGAFAAIALEFDAANGVNTTLPVTPLP